MGGWCRNCCRGSEHLAWPLGAKSALVPLGPAVAALAGRTAHRHPARPLALAGLDRLVGLAADGPTTRPRFVTTVHGLYSVSRYSAIMTRGERVIAVSDTVRAYLRRHYPELSTRRVQVIQRGWTRWIFPTVYRPTPDWLADWYRHYP